MMAPTLLRTPTARAPRSGSGGSERIRSALLCALVALVDRARRWRRRSRARGCTGTGSAAGGAGTAARRRSTPWRRARRCSEWDARDLYFGGVHAVPRDTDGAVDAAATPGGGGAAAALEL
jgi:gamma-glutamyltranspeptidase/glutathione hydrolase